MSESNQPNQHTAPPAAGAASGTKGGDDDDAASIDTFTMAITKARTSPRMHPPSPLSSSDSSDPEVVAVRAPKPRKSPHKRPPPSSSSDSSDAEEVTKPAPKRLATKLTTPKPAKKRTITTARSGSGDKKKKKTSKKLQMKIGLRVKTTRKLLYHILPKEEQQNII